MQDVNTDVVRATQRQLNEIAVSDRATLGGLTQFPRDARARAP